MVSFGKDSAVFKFGSIVRDAAIHARDLNTHVAPRRLDGFPSPGKRLSAVLPAAHAERGGLGEDHPGQPVGILGLAQNSQ